MALHKRTFPPEHRFYVRLRRPINRDVLERRLWFYFAVHNYHYSKDNPLTIEFRKKAKHVLSREYMFANKQRDKDKETMKNLAYFNKASIKAMPIEDVDRFLASLGLHLEANESDRRKALWEWYNRPSSELIAHLGYRGHMVRAYRKGLANNKYYLRDLILKHPTLTYHQFQEQYGEHMPTVTRKSYGVARSLLRKAGYDIPRLPTKIPNPTVERNVYGHLQKSRVLNTIENENGS